MYCVPKEVGSFESRKLFPQSWGGLRAEELQIETGISTATFCHNNRFICCAQTKEDAVKLAQIAVNAE